MLAHFGGAAAAYWGDSLAHSDLRRAGKLCAAAAAASAASVGAPSPRCAHVGELGAVGGGGERAAACAPRGAGAAAGASAGRKLPRAAGLWHAEPARGGRPGRASEPAEAVTVPHEQEVRLYVCAHYKVRRQRDPEQH